MLRRDFFNCTVRLRRQARGMDLVTIVVVYCFLIAAFFFAMWIFYDRRDYALFDHERRKSTFRCARCGHLYAVAGRPEECVCPKCGYENARLKY